MTSENINIVLTNAVCCISNKAKEVSRLLSIGDKCTESELIKLKLLNDYVEIIRCYSNTNINSKFFLKIPYNNQGNSPLDNTSVVGFNYIIIINNIEYTVSGDSVTSIRELLLNIVPTINQILTFNIIDTPDGFTDRFSMIYIESECNVKAISFKIFDIEKSEIINELSYINYQTGICNLENCFRQEDINEIINKIMAACEICECQLTK